MRFGISEISWMLPKILRIRRAEAVWVCRLAGASIALVAMMFPALRGNAPVAPRNWFPAAAGMCRGALPPGLPLQCVEPVRRFGPCPGEDGKSPGRTSPCGGAVYLLDEADIILFRGL